MTITKQIAIQETSCFLHLIFESKFYQDTPMHMYLHAVKIVVVA